MSDHISASPDFRLSILAVLLYTDWLLRYGTIIQPEYFPSKDEQEIVRWVNIYYDTYKGIPSDSDLDNGLHDNLLLSDVYAVSENDLDYASDIALDFARQQAMKIAFLDSIDDVKKGELEKVLPRMQEALAVGNDMLGMGAELIADRNDWLYDEIHGRRYPTGWMRVDKLLEGGIVGGEYGLIMAPTGMGKTTALVNIGFALAGLVSAANVLHISYEMPARKILKRYAARVVGCYAPRGSGLDDYAKELEDAARIKLRAKLRVVSPDDKSLTGIMRLIDNLDSAGFYTNALIVDYPDLMKPPRRHDERRFELTDIARSLRELGGNYDIPVWGATQAGRHALHKDIITVADIAEDIGKAAIADVVLALCQTKDEEGMQRGRLFCAKMRDAPGGISVPVTIDLTRCLIVQRGS